MENKINKMKVELPSIFGSTTINHAARVSLLLNASEYIMMDYIYRCVQNKKEMDIIETYRQTGFTTDQQKILLINLVKKGFVFPDQAPLPKITSKWESAFANLKVEFDNLIWRKSSKVFFTGSNRKSFSFYHKLRKKYSREFLVKQRDHYADFLEMQHKTGFNQSVMSGERWLNPANENYLINWKELADNVRKEIKKKEEEAAKKGKTTIIKTETVNSKERKSQYEQDSNQ